MADVAEGQVRIASDALGVALETGGGVFIRLGEAPATLSGTGGGWAEVARPKRAALTEWVGHPARRVTLPILIDGWRGQVSVEEACGTLERLAQALPGEAITPLVRVTGNVPRADLEYVIDGVDWGDVVIYRDGVRMRQDAVVNLLEYVPGGNLVLTATPLGGSVAKKYRHYRVRKGDNLTRIAARFLGNGNRWREIAALNNRRGWQLPGSMIGRYLKLPIR